MKEASGSKKGSVYDFGTDSYSKSIVQSMDLVTSRFKGDTYSTSTQVNLQRLHEEIREEVRQELQQEMQETIHKASMEMEE